MILAEQRTLSSRARQGLARLTVEQVAGASVMTEARSRTPLKLLAHKPRGTAVWAYLSSFGGGMLAGDEAAIQVTVRAGAACFLSTQASTKVYTSDTGAVARQELTAEVASNALLVVAPDPVQCFAGARYEQRQHFSIESASGLVFVDALSAGRSARGERWAFQRYLSRTEIFVDGKRAALDALRLDAGGDRVGPFSVMGRFNCLATVMIFGERLKAERDESLKAVNAMPTDKRETFICSASALSSGVILRMAGESLETVTRFIAARLAFLQSALGEDPFQRKW